MNGGVLQRLNLADQTTAIDAGEDLQHTPGSFDEGPAVRGGDDHSGFLQQRNIFLGLPSDHLPVEGLGLQSQGGEQFPMRIAELLPKVLAS